MGISWDYGANMVWILRVYDRIIYQGKWIRVMKNGI